MLIDSLLKPSRQILQYSFISLRDLRSWMLDLCWSHKMPSLSIWNLPFHRFCDLSLILSGFLPYWNLGFYLNYLLLLQILLRWSVVCVGLAMHHVWAAMEMDLWCVTLAQLASSLCLITITCTRKWSKWTWLTSKIEAKPTQLKIFPYQLLPRW